MKFKIDIERKEDFQFLITFDEDSMGTLLTDEPEDFGGKAQGPSPGRLLGAAALNCLMASLTYCMNKKRADLRSLKGSIVVNLDREDGRLRVTKMDAVLRPELDESELKKLEGCIEIFEDFCVVTQSIRNGIEVDVKVEPEV